MRKLIQISIICIIIQLLSFKVIYAQTKDSLWTLKKCIDYALNKNLDIKKADYTAEKNMISTDQVKANRFPVANASISQNFGWNKTPGLNNQYSDYTGLNSTNYGVNSSMTVFNGNKIKYTINQSELVYQASKFDSETLKESVSLSILDAFLQVLYAEESVKNNEKQVETSREQLRLSQERMNLGSASKSDYLQVKSQLATEKLTLAQSESQLAINRVTLMQLMEIPVYNNFSINSPDLNAAIKRDVKPIVDSIYNTALNIKPQIKSVNLALQSAQLGVNIAKANRLPLISLNGGISTGYSSSNKSDYSTQFTNGIYPQLGMTLSVPIYQNKLIRSNIETSKLDVQIKEVNVNYTKNQLRKSIEQVCVDVNSAEKEFEASREQYDASLESYQVAAEKYNQGMLNSADFLIQKTNLIIAESKLLQSKYNLIFTYKKLDFYTGIPLTL
ncbi:MAG: TolC family protein [Bacteroidota bacterium]|nr:TolC family protein [Bacteroidota bacterium]